MNKYLTVIISFLIFSGTFGVMNAFPQADLLDNALAQYFDALKTGNVAILKSVLSDELLQRRSKALNSPRYSEFLKSIYGQAEFKIINITQSTSDQASVDVEVISDNQTQINETITFIKENGIWKLHKDRKDTQN
jgi:hypothetical protein